MSEAAPRLLVQAELGEWTHQWDSLVDRAPLPSPFLRSWWLLAASNASARRFLLVIRDSSLIGGLALQQERCLGLPRLRMMGSGSLCPDHLDLLSAPAHEDLVAAAAAGWLARRGHRIVDLDGVVADSLLVRTLPGVVRLEDRPGAPWIPLDDDADRYLAQRPASLRKTLRKAAARLDAQGAEYHIRRGSAAVDALEGLREMHLAQWGSRSRFLPGFDLFAEACARGAKVDEIAVHDLSAGPTTVAIMVSFEVAGRVSLYQSARLTEQRWRDATSVLLSAIITDAINRGFREVDFLRGEEAYKSGFATEYRRLVRLHAATGSIGVAGMTSLAAARRFRQRAVQRGGLGSSRRRRPA